MHEPYAVSVARLIVRAYVRDQINSVCFRLESLGRLYPQHQPGLKAVADMLGFFLDNGFPRDQIEALDLGHAILQDATEQAARQVLPLHSYHVTPLAFLINRCKLRR